MSCTLFAKRPSAAILIVIAVVLVTFDGKTSDAAAATTLQIEAGETLEIGTDMGGAESEFSWILTKDQKFQSAQRTRFFQTRLTEPGTYVLDTTIQNAEGTTQGSLYQTFTLIVTEPTGTMAFPGDRTQPLSAVLQTNPAAINGSVYIGSEGGILKIDPSQSNGQIGTYRIDLDTSTDSDGDGNPANDTDNRGTLSEKSGTPLSVFMQPKNLQRVVSLAVSDTVTGETKTSSVTAIFGPPPAGSDSSQTISDPNSPILMQLDEATVRFSAQLREPEAQGKELLYEWDFGDRSRSLLYTPIHTYQSAGTYRINLRIRDIRTAEVLYEGTQTITIDTVPVTNSSVSSSAASSGTPENQSSISIKAILYVVFIVVSLLSLAIGLYALLVWIKRKTTTGLQKTLEKMEGTIVHKDAVLSEVTKPAVLQLKKAEPKLSASPQKPEIISEREKSKEEFRTQDRTNETPTAASGPVPSWLSKAAPKAVPAPAAPPARTPTPVPVPTPAPTPAPVPTPTPSAPVSRLAPPSPEPVTPAPRATEKAPTPDWLKPQTPAPASAPVPTEIPRPAPAPTSPATNIPEPSKPVADAKTVEPEKKVAPPTVAAPLPKPVVAEKPIPQPILPMNPVIAEEKKDADETPIAIIQADSISK